MSVAWFESRKRAIRPTPDQRSSRWPSSTILDASLERKSRSSPSSAWWTTHTHTSTPRPRRYESLKRLSDSEVNALALFEQSCEASRASASSCATSSGSSHTYSPAWWSSASFLVSPADEETATLLGALAPGCCIRVGRQPWDPDHRLYAAFGLAHCRQVKQSSAGFEGAACWVRWGSFSVYGMKLHLLCAQPIGPLSYELTAANKTWNTKL
jgi:hypothetical protein